MNVEIVQEGRVDQFSRFVTSGNECSALPKVFLEPRPLADVIQFPGSVFLPEASVDISPVSQERKLEILDAMFQVAAVPPGGVVRRSRFDNGKPYVPVDVVGSRLVSLYVQDDEITAVFVQHHFTVDPDEEHEKAKDQYVQERIDASMSGQTFREARNRMPTPPWLQVLENIYSRKNGKNVLNKDKREERVAALIIHWDLETNVDRENPFVQEFLRDKKLDDAIALFELMQVNWQVKARVESQEKYYKDQIKEMYTCRQKNMCYLPLSREELLSDAVALAAD